jgi:CheY-like chemotaxis protein
MKTILVVDDDLNIRRLYQAELETEGYRVLVAENGKRALEIIHTEPLNIVVMDIRMPEMNGLEAMARILKEEKNVPVILNTAYSSYLDNFSTWAAEGCLIKSADMQALKDKIREICARVEKK